MDRGCVSDVIRHFAGTPNAELLRPGLADVEPWADLGDRERPRPCGDRQPDPDRAQRRRRRRAGSTEPGAGAAHVRRGPGRGAPGLRQGSGVTSRRCRTPSATPSSGCSSGPPVRARVDLAGCRIRATEAQAAAPTPVGGRAVACRTRRRPRWTACGGPSATARSVASRRTSPSSHRSTSGGRHAGGPRCPAAGRDADPPRLDLRLGPATTFHPVTPAVYLGVHGDVAALHALRGRIFHPPLERPTTRAFVPHVTLADELDPDRIPAAVPRWPTTWSTCASRPCTCSRRDVAGCGGRSPMRGSPAAGYPGEVYALRPCPATSPQSAGWRTALVTGAPSGSALRWPASSPPRAPTSWSWPGTRPASTPRRRAGGHGRPGDGVAVEVLPADLADGASLAAARPAWRTTRRPSTCWSTTPGSAPMAPSPRPTSTPRRRRSPST